MTLPKNPLPINFHNDLIGSGDINMSTEMELVEIHEEDKRYVKETEKNFVLFKLPGRMKEGSDCSTQVVRFGLNVQATFERESKYTIKVPIFFA